MTLPLPKRSCARRTLDGQHLDDHATGMYSTEPTSSLGPVPWPLPCTACGDVLMMTLLGPCCMVTAL